MSSFREKRKEDVPSDQSALRKSLAEDRKKRLAVIVDRAKLVFPGLIDDWGSSIRITAQDHPGKVKIELLKLIDERLADMSEKEREHLLKRENAAECCLKLGMRKVIVDVKFEATRAVEKEMGFTGKTPILHSIAHLINYLDSENPFGEAPANNDSLNIVRNFREKNWLSYLGVKLPKGYVKDAVDKAAALLGNQPGQGQWWSGGGGVEKDPFMHGTTGTVLDTIFANNGRIKVSNQTETVRHNFGEGVYCYKDLQRAFSFAFDHVWPYIHINEATNELEFKDATNPAVIVFEDTEAKTKNIFQVGAKKYPISDKRLQKRMSPDDWDQFLTLRGRYDKSDVDAAAAGLDRPPLSRWKQFVKLTRCYDIRPEGKDVFQGYLHDCGTAQSSNEADVDPVVDEDLWEQFCVVNPHVLRWSRLFIEFHIDWNEWLKTEMSYGDAQAAKEEVDAYVRPSTPT